MITLTATKVLSIFTICERLHQDLYHRFQCASGPLPDRYTGLRGVYNDTRRLQHITAAGSAPHIHQVNYELMLKCAGGYRQGNKSHLCAIVWGLTPTAEEPNSLRAVSLYWAHRLEASNVCEKVTLADRAKHSDTDFRGPAKMFGLIPKICLEYPTDIGGADIRSESADLQQLLDQNLFGLPKRLTAKF